ncbi:hypothetical protein CC78DRAFT_573291 [Lojkania enalia]|uniref:Uncharacterized protein n=1 Tax=Lojkania enalia TaxID=147567 RepID=A0A9P4NCU5_9PLEO|nr:hypothetical protein CC78DRAFT_573291 [Didymosphaeria enalia]
MSRGPLPPPSSSSSLERATSASIILASFPSPLIFSDVPPKSSEILSSSNIFRESKQITRVPSPHDAEAPRTSPFPDFDTTGLPPNTLVTDENPDQSSKPILAPDVLSSTPPKEADKATAPNPQVQNLTTAFQEELSPPPILNSAIGLEGSWLMSRS